MGIICVVRGILQENYFANYDLKRSCLKIYFTDYDMDMLITYYLLLDICRPPISNHD
jgi:hypothetical protein